VLEQIADLAVRRDAPLSEYTRFGIGGPADLLVETADESAFLAALRTLRAGSTPYVVIGGGTNLIVSDDGFRGVVLRFIADRIDVRAPHLAVCAGARLQDVVDDAAAHGLQGIETLAGIPGTFGAAVYGNAGAYGHSISERISSVRFCDGDAVRSATGAECLFRYRDSIFKHHKDWVVFSAELALDPADPVSLRRQADDILHLRNQKFPSTMKCAGSVFKNLLAAELPPEVVAAIPPTAIREGKIPAAYFLEQVGAKGLSHGGIHVADYHANLLYNDGAGTARDFRALTSELRARVHAHFGIALEEEVQYVGSRGD
jgi:UDP-N-acetylmuramate dehydrogenase